MFIQQSFCLKVFNCNVANVLILNFCDGFFAPKGTCQQLNVRCDHSYLVAGLSGSFLMHVRTANHLNLERATVELELTMVGWKLLNYIFFILRKMSSVVIFCLYLDKGQSDFKKRQINSYCQLIICLNSQMCCFGLRGESWKVLVTEIC